MPIVTLAGGEISELHVGLKGTMNALLLKDLAAKTHRGLRGRVEEGKSGGGLRYGYKVVSNSMREEIRSGVTERSTRPRRLSSAASSGNSLRESDHGQLPAH